MIPENLSKENTLDYYFISVWTSVASLLRKELHTIDFWEHQNSAVLGDQSGFKCFSRSKHTLFLSGKILEFSD